VAPTPPAPPAPRDPATPFWAPVGVDLDCVPPEVHQAAAELVQPVYEQCVLRAAGGIEKSLGVTVAHLLWLEILEQFDLKREYTEVQAVLRLPGQRREVIDQHLRMLDSKVRVGYILVRLQELRQRAAERERLLPRISVDRPLPVLVDPPNGEGRSGKTETG
jgi:hypothetical protein